MDEDKRRLERKRLAELEQRPTVVVPNPLPVTVGAGSAAIGTVALTAGSATVGKMNLIDGYGWSPECTPMDELRTVIPVRLVGATFTGSALDTSFWTATIAASGGTVATADLTTMPGALTLSSKTDAAGSVVVQSNRAARYTGGSSNRYRAQVQLGDTGKANNTKRWGLFNGTDGAYFKLSGTTLSVCTMKASSETAVASASWNGSTVVPTLTNVNTYEIYITNSKVYFVIAGVLVHTASFLTATWSATPTLPVRADNINSGNTTDTVMYVRVMTAYRLGELVTQPTSYYHASGTTAGVQVKIGAGNLHTVVFGSAANNAVITLVDNTTGSTPVLWVYTATGALAAPVSIDFHGMPFSTGLRFVVGTGNASFTIVYE